ncbi:MAG: DUF1847 domain-containing protein [Candidatus Methanoliparum thermophilum]|uniref:DUF1847 domain-containing protein n=1 Tax=Methanoliparum thermophilum TaxID=2491083 RepID=A0A520KR67_METT2|nr:DUF1847 domain-containing protein [Candidatus Methanoliparum sp. LAM-1]RZN64113.1 MAG: DUF1847 domain-containing protein [Candidatus Methanoliparum thermophilum]BDC35624.1 hypothetical protein MTLP_03060 [Candidatus Methanoliparum sp. LAM-1]
MKEEIKSMCAKCLKNPCYSDPDAKKPKFCPMINKKEVIEEAMKEYSGELLKFYQASAKQEKDGYLRPSDVIHPIKCRIEEIMEFAEKMGYKRLGIAFCIGLKEETSNFTKILEDRGFDVLSVCCKCGAFDKEYVGLNDEDKIVPGRHESMCNPITQAAILNNEKSEFNIVLGLCVGHDSLFFKYSNAPTTVLAAKDRLLGHNPLAALYTHHSYYFRL